MIRFQEGDRKIWCCGVIAVLLLSPALVSGETQIGAAGQTSFVFLSHQNAPVIATWVASTENSTGSFRLYRGHDDSNPSLIAEMGLRNRIRDQCVLWFRKVRKGAVLSRYRFQFNLCRDQLHPTQRMQKSGIRMPILNRLTSYVVATR